jgi:hypothetical protein
MEYGPEIMEYVDGARRAKEALDEKNSTTVYCLVRALEDAGVTHAQAEAARLLKVSRTVTNRHVRKVRAWLEPAVDVEYREG